MTRSGGWPKVLLFFAFLQIATAEIVLDTHEIKIRLGDVQVVDLAVSNLTTPGAKLQFIVQHEDLVTVTPSEIILEEKSYNISVEATGAGKSEIYSNITTRSINVDNVFLLVTIYKNAGLETFSLIIGWIYFAAWSISFYPQIYSNYKRKSVIGLNFDFLWLNVIGFTLYGIFNLGLYFIPEIIDEYTARHPRGLNPVKVNDIVFAVHAAVACLITIGQCFVYERGEQRVSITAKSIITFFGVFLLISIILAGCAVIHWLDFLYYCSYVKLTITLIKYVPQAYMNYKRKSTVGWSIGNIFLDFTGGTLSMLQMILDSYNYDDWISIFGDPTKFGLGLFSVVFDIFFIVQHYILYRHTNYEES